MRRDGGGIDERFAAHVRERGDHHLRVAALLTGDWHAAALATRTSRTAMRSAY
jgi:hypothetical protein